MSHNASRWKNGSRGCASAEQRDPAASAIVNWGIAKLGEGTHIPAPFL